MKAEMVFIDPPKLKATPFTTSEVVAEFAGVQHHAVQQMCVKYKSDLEGFGIFAFEMRKLDGRGRPETVYHLNEGQAMFLLALLKNTPTVVAFKKRLVMEFQRMKAELTKREVSKARGLPARRTLTEAIRDCLSDTPGKCHYYKIYTDLAYKSAVGMDAAHIRKERGAAPDANAAEWLTSEELEAVRIKEGQIAALIEAGMGYKAIKEALLGADAR